MARAAHALGATSRRSRCFRGHTGKWLAETLAAEGVPTVAVWTHGENRASLSVADRETGGLTEFYEHGSEVPSAAWTELVERRRPHVAIVRLVDHQRIDAAGRAR